MGYMGVCEWGQSYIDQTDGGLDIGLLVVERQKCVELVTAYFNSILLESYYGELATSSSSKCVVYSADYASSRRSQQLLLRYRSTLNLSQSA